MWRALRTLARADESLRRHPALVLVLLSPLFLLIGLAITRVGTSTYDSVSHQIQGAWLIGKWRGESLEVPFETIKWYGPLWEYVLAPFGAALAFLRDPLCVRHAVTFSLLPVTLLATYILLRRAGETAGTALLAVALIAGNVRLLGHSIHNVKDFPFACGYLLVTLLMFVLLQEMASAPGGVLGRPRGLMGLVLISIVPYLLRVPSLAHWLLLVVLCLWTALFAAGSVGRLRRWFLACLPLWLGPVLVFGAWPALWETGPTGFASTFALFSRFGWEGTVRVFGRQLASTQLPWWYGPAWIAVSWDPIGLLVLAAGVGLFAPLALRELVRARPWPLAPLLTMPVWVGLFAFAPWAALLALRPVLYDEDRHLLFAMPLLAVAAALGLRRLSERNRYVLAGLLLASSAWAALGWGKHAYIYKNPALPRSANSDFTGDYWGVGIGALAQALYDHVPDGEMVLMRAPGDVLVAELERRPQSLLLRHCSRKSFQLKSKARRAGRFYVASVNRDGSSTPLLEDVAAGKAREVWREELPDGGVAALLVHYEGPCDDCPERLAPP